MVGVVAVIWGDREQEYFCGRDWTGSITLKPLQKIDLPRTSAICPTGRGKGAAQLVTAVTSSTTADGSRECVRDDRGQSSTVTAIPAIRPQLCEPLV